MNNINKTIFILLLLLFFLFVVKNQTKENFITWYLPFFNEGTTGNIKVPDYILSNTVVNQLEYDYINKINFYLPKKEDKMIVKGYYDFLFANVLKTMKLKELYISQEINPIKLYDKVNENPYHLAVVSAPSLLEVLSKNINKIKNINSVISVSYNYIFVITNKNKRISNLLGLHEKTLNIGEKFTDEFYLGKDIIKNLNINQEFKVNETNYPLETAFKKLISGEIDGMIYTDLYPNFTLNKYILKDFSKILILLPLDDINKEVFKKRHRYMENVFIDLNLLPKNYLPIKVNELEFTKFRPNLSTFKYPNFIICNKNAPPKLSFQIVNSIVNNLDIINKSDYIIKNGYNYLAFPEISNIPFIPDHIGAKIYFQKVSIYTTQKSYFCKYFIGNAECTPERIEGSKIIVSN